MILYLSFIVHQTNQHAMDQKNITTELPELEEPRGAAVSRERPQYIYIYIYIHTIYK